MGAPPFDRAWRDYADGIKRRARDLSAFGSRAVSGDHWAVER
jgi:hypothetical protein